MAIGNTDKGVRRVITGERPDGRSRVWLDGDAPNVKRPTEKIQSVLLWATAGSPADYSTDEDAGQWQLGTSPPFMGSRFVHFTLAPGGERTEPHRNDTVDLTVGVSGELTFYFDDGSVVLRPGETLVQRGTMHHIANHGDVPAVTVTVLLDGAPKRDGSLERDEQAR